MYDSFSLLNVFGILDDINSIYIIENIEMQRNESYVAWKEDFVFKLSHTDRICVWKMKDKL